MNAAIRPWQSFTGATIFFMGCGATVDWRAVLLMLVGLVEIACSFSNCKACYAISSAQALIVTGIFAVLCGQHLELLGLGIFLVLAFVYNVRLIRYARWR